MTSNLLGISVTGLKVSQTHLSTTGHNIANAGVEGYSRQRVDVDTNPATLVGGSFVGNGANVSSIKRIVNQFITEQLRTDTSLFESLESYHSNIAQLDGVLSDIATGLSSGLESFFSSMQNAADEPTSIPARQLVISEAENLADRFNTLYGRFESIESGVDESLTSAIEQVNALTANIANLNLKISDAMGNGEGASPNDLLDQRDEALRMLSEFVSLQTYEQGNGQINVVIGSGQNLVVGTEFRTLQLVPSDEDATVQDIIFVDNQGGQVITDTVRGGEIGGLLEFRDQAMSQTYNEFGRIAVVMADTFNEAHQKGVTLANQYGGLFFYDVNDPIAAGNRVIANSNNTPPADGLASLSIIDSSQLSTSDYNLTVSSGGLFRVERLSDNTEITSGILPGYYPYTVSFDGLELVFEGGSFVDGDSFKLQPFKAGGRDFDSMLVSADQIAFASPILTDASIGNRGNGIISPGEVNTLEDIDGNPISLLATPGSMNPPLIVRFTTPSTYDILDNSDPGDPRDLDPPIRNQRFVPGILNDLFSVDPAETMVSTEGELLGIPRGRSAANNAALRIGGALAPDFAVSDFSGVNQFSFEIDVSNTLGGINDTTPALSLTISGAAILDEDDLIQEINSQLSGSDVRAYMVDDGIGGDTLGFRLLSSGYGDITLQNYTGPAGPSVADSLFGFALSTTASFTTVANADGVSGNGALTNGYPAEALTITRAPATAGATPTTYNVFTNLNASARETASALSNIPGVAANAFNYLELSNFNISLTEPLQLSLNNENLLEYTIDSASGNSILATVVPDPQLDPLEFQDYLAQRINQNSALSAAGIYAVAAQDTVSGYTQMRIYSTVGDDLSFSLSAEINESIDISDGQNDALRLSSAGNGIDSSIVVGGRMDVSLEEGLSLSSFPPVSMLFGDTGVSNFASRTYLGIQASISGVPQEGDAFTLDFNSDASSDNRNALIMVNLEGDKTLDNGLASYSDGYGSLVERIGIDTSSTITNRDAAEQVVDQSEARRNSISAVNLDEEAADLIRFEQMFAANAQVIAVARDLFDRLINSF